MVDHHNHTNCECCGKHVTDTPYGRLFKGHFFGDYVYVCQLSCLMTLIKEEKAERAHSLKIKMNARMSELLGH